MDRGRVELRCRPVLGSPGAGLGSGETATLKDADGKVRDTYEVP